MGKIWNDKRGVTLIEALVGLGLLALFSAGIYSAFQTILLTSKTARSVNIASDLLNERAEFIRNLPYSSVGIVGGVPAGVIQPQEQYTRNGEAFTVNNYVRNIDDPFDGVAGGTPNDTAPADYKLVQMDALCTSCGNAKMTSLVIRVAPKGLESASMNGSLFVNVIDASGLAISGANVSITNNSVTPAIAISDITDINGVYQLVDTPTSTGGYRISATKTGYSMERTYPIGDPWNPNPKKPDANVTSQQLTSIYLQIDRLGALNLATKDLQCRPVGNSAVSVSGTKRIGTNPDILKFSTTTATNASGTLSLPLEFDSYSMSFDDSSRYLNGVMPYGYGFSINPGAAVSKTAVLSSGSPNALLVSIFDATTSAPIADAQISITAGGTNRSAITGYSSVSDTDWSLGNYTQTDGYIDTTGTPGLIALLADGNMKYPTSTPHWLISQTFDLGSSTNVPATLEWTANAPGGTAVKFQIAVNNDNATWNYVGPGGDPNAYFTATSTLSGAIPGNARYVRYKTYLSTTNAALTPSLLDVKITFSGGCVPQNQSLFAGLSSNIYVVTVNRSGYSQYQSTINVSQPWQEAVINLQGL